MNNYGQERGHTMAQGKAKAAKKTLMFFLDKTFFLEPKFSVPKVKKKKSEPK